MSKILPLIAIVDDDGSVRLALTRLFRSAGLEVVTFSSGRELLEGLTGRLPDCVVLDLHMSGCGGVETQARMAQSGHRVPIIVITGHDTPEDHKRVMDAGASAYLRKPVDDQVLLDAVLNAVSQGPKGGAASA